MVSDETHRVDPGVNQNTIKMMMDGTSLTVLLGM